MDNNIGKRLDGRYELLELIGVGGMADIYKAHDIVDDKIVAAKILKNEFAGSEDFLRRFRNESKAIALLSHPNIVKIYDVGFSDKVQFIVMEYIDGITLTEFIERQGVLKWRDAIHFTTQILRALQHAHDRGIVHRDIKSQNVMLLPDGMIKVMDFGIARFNRETDKTISEKAIGSVHYISPEQARGDVTDEKSDIYSVGVMLYEMLTGKKPFDGDNPVSIALMHMQSQAKKLTDINSSVPEGLEEITIKAMQKTPQKRYQTAGEMIKDIEEFKKNPSIVFEYKYFSTDGTTKYFDKVGEPEARKAVSYQSVNRNNDEDVKKPRTRAGGYDAYDEDDEDYDYDDVAERRSPLLPILFSVASVFVIITAVLIFKIVTDTFTSLEEAVGEDHTMPKLIGMDYDEVASTYNYLTIVAEQEWSSEYEKGQVMKQSVPTGRKVKSNQQITVTVSRGPHLINLDDYGNGIRHKDEVIAAIKKQGFTNYQPRYVEDDDVAADFVIGTDPPAYTQLQQDAQIIIYISYGKAGEMTNVPDLIGNSLVTAQEKAEMYKILLIVREEASTEAEKGKIISQSIDAMTEVAYYTTVEVVIGTGEPPAKRGSFGETIKEGKTGNYKIEYYIDGVLQEELTEIRNVELRRDLSWEFENTGVHVYTMYLTSMKTGLSAKFLEYEFDFTGEEVKGTELYFNKQIFSEIDKEVEETTTTTTDPDVTEPDEEDYNDSYDYGNEDSGNEDQTGEDMSED